MAVTDPAEVMDEWSKENKNTPLSVGGTFSGHHRDIQSQHIAELATSMPKSEDGNGLSPCVIVSPFRKEACFGCDLVL